MSKYTAAQRQPLDEERDLRVALLREEIRLALWKQIAIPDAKVYIALGLGADSSWQALKSAGDAPPRITINQRRYVLTTDLKAWLEARPKTLSTKGSPGNNEQHDEDDAKHQAAATARSSFASPLQQAAPHSHPHR